MTPDERELILSLVVYPGSGGPKGSSDDVLRHFGTKDGTTLGLELLRDALERQDGTDVEMALIVCGTFGFNKDHLGPLVSLSTADWHQKHEDVVSALGKLRTPDAIDALYRATQWIPAYLDYDENRALATKAIWALGSVSGPEAEQALSRLTDSEDDIVREEAESQLARRRKS